MGCWPRHTASLDQAKPPAIAEEPPGPHGAHVPPAARAAEGAGVEGAGGAREVTAPGRLASLYAERPSMCACQRAAFGCAAPSGGPSARSSVTSACLGFAPESGCGRGRGRGKARKGRDSDREREAEG